MPPKRKSNSQGSSQPPAKRARKTKTKATRTRRTTTFFDLPAELRNDIYELALIEPHPIRVTKSHKPPKLLRASRQIRSEACQIYYLRNTFVVKVHNCDAALAVAFETHAKHFDDAAENLRVAERIAHEMSGRKVWSGVERWCQRIWERDLSTWHPGEGDSRRDAVVRAAMGIVAAARDGGKGEWEVVRQALQGLRNAMGLVDRAWLRN